MSNEFVEPLPLRDANVSERPLVCPDCRSPIEGVFRYGRLLNFSMIRGLERKHLMAVDALLDELAELAEQPLASVSDSKAVDTVLDQIRRGPMQSLFEACGGSPLVEVPVPPSGPQIRALELRAVASAAVAGRRRDAAYCRAEESYQEAIQMAMDHISLRSAAHLKLSLVKFWIKFADRPSDVRDAARTHLQWVSHLAHEARTLIERLDRNDNLLQEVFVAMSGIQGSNYGTSASSHWYECPNGHSYVIGECGGAMEESRCPDCGARVGGGRHQLLGTNRRATDFVERAMGVG